MPEIKRLESDDVWLREARREPTAEDFAERLAELLRSAGLYVPDESPLFIERQVLKLFFALNQLCEERPTSRARSVALPIKLPNDEFWQEKVLPHFVGEGGSYEEAVQNYKDLVNFLSKNQ